MRMAQGEFAFAFHCVAVVQDSRGVGDVRA